MFVGYFLFREQQILSNTDKIPTCLFLTINLLHDAIPYPEIGDAFLKGTL